MSTNLSLNLSALEDRMPRLSPDAAARYQHIHPLRTMVFTRPLEGPVTLNAITDFAAQCFSNGVPGNAAIGPEGTTLVARWTVPMEDYPRNR